MPHFHAPGVGAFDEGVSVGQAAALNFVGGGVVVTDAGNGVKTVTIAGGGAASILAPDILANRPSAVTAGSGALYYANDVELLYRSNGATWDNYSILDALQTGDIGTLVASPEFVVAMAAAL